MGRTRQEDPLLTQLVSRSESRATLYRRARAPVTVRAHPPSSRMPIAPFDPSARLCFRVGRSVVRARARLRRASPCACALVFVRARERARASAPGAAAAEEAGADHGARAGPDHLPAAITVTAVTSVTSVTAVTAQGP